MFLTFLDKYTSSQLFVSQYLVQKHCILYCFARRCLTLSCVATVLDGVESVLALGYSCEEVRQSVSSGFTEEGHLAYTSVPAQQSSDTITAAGPIPFTIN